MADIRQRKDNKEVLQGKTSVASKAFYILNTRDYSDAE